ncbi:MAG: Phosphatidyl-N-methylethanolamine N-methyltransferase [Heterodermia speciosa]|uniref:Phosphatidyl-N-methylethanolamine N-methyltransferase n=1 Tax=Heterodermia speciosa TaxID=116794 RepID=A0A8H3ESA3_9LECA|nr:MAG: Phosphatidyl-N-methylethanolamine N-methyltransferase [Heterodermia speciosa]
MDQLVDLSQTSLYVSATAIAFNPTFWKCEPPFNITVARQEYHNKVLTRLFNGNSLRACYALAITIFSLGLFRDYLYKSALDAQPYHSTFHLPLLAYALLAAGNVLVLSSTWALGIVGTYLGDYFGILMDEPVTSFPFNLTGAPMYYGSAMSFLGTALLYGKPAGVFLTGEVLVVYLIALTFEE